MNQQHDEPESWIRQREYQRLNNPKHVRAGIVSGRIERLSCHGDDYFFVLQTFLGGELQCRFSVAQRDQVGALYELYPPADVVVRGFIPAGSNIATLTKIQLLEEL